MNKIKEIMKAPQVILTEGAKPINPMYVCRFMNRECMSKCNGLNFNNCSIYAIKDKEYKLLK